MYLKLVALSCLLALSQAGKLSLSHEPTVAANEISTNTRIIGGHDAEIGQFPYIISLQCIIPNDFIYFCGGSIINSRWIATAAHCIKEYYKSCPSNSLYIKAGKHKIHSTGPHEQLVKVEKYFVHEKYRFEPNISEHDIAILKLKTPLEINTYVRPIRLPEPNSEPKGNAVAAGWGKIQAEPPVRPDTLQTVDLSIINREICNFSISLISPVDTVNLYETNICTGPLYGGVATCSGDSGGPIIVNDNGHEKLVGIVSWGFNDCGMRFAPSIHVKVSDYVYWIIDKMVNN